MFYVIGFVGGNVILLILMRLFGCWVDRHEIRFDQNLEPKVKVRAPLRRQACAD